MAKEEKESRKAVSPKGAPKDRSPVRKVIDELREFIEDLIEPPRPLVPVPVPARRHRRTRRR